MTPFELAELHAKAFTVPRPFSALEFQTFLNDPSVFVVTTTGGFALGRCVLDEVELITIAVEPEMRRQGKASLLLAEFEAVSHQRNAATVFLEVDEANTVAFSLYDGAGFSEVGRRHRYYRHENGARTDALVMRKTLGKSA